jgi:F-type H+-transporting ATPase subunit a
MVLNDLETTITKHIHPSETKKIIRYRRTSLCWFSRVLPVFFVILFGATRTNAQARSTLLANLTLRQALDFAPLNGATLKEAQSLTQASGQHEQARSAWFPQAHALTRMAPQATEHADSATAEKEEAEQGVSQKPVAIARIFGFPITNSMILSWVVALGLIIYVQVATRKMKQIPDGAQNFLEWLVGSLYGFLEGLLGRHLVDRTFWFFATIFIFILSANWVGLIPGVGTVGRGHMTPHGFKIDQPFFRGANADVNMTLAMALVFFGCWIYWALRENGPLGFLKELFAPKGESSGFLKVILVVVFFAVGCLEIVSILFRPVSLSFRLYGNTFAGEKMLETMANLVPAFSWLIPIPFYFLELLVGVVQALVFMLLTAVFTLLICPQEEKASAASQD